MAQDKILETFNLLMTDKDVKRLFDADISARIPYRLHCCVYNFDREVWEEDDILYSYDLGGNCQTLKILNERGACLMYYQIRPYLRPMSSMTDEEKKECCSIFNNNMYQFEVDKYGDVESTEPTFEKECLYYDAELMAEWLEWLNAHHFDYRWLINKGLALEAPEGMY